MMEQLMQEKQNKTGIAFILIALLSLLGGAIFGCIGAIQYIKPDFLSSVPFFKIRPLHVSLVVTWIFFSAVGGIYNYLPAVMNVRWKLKKLQTLHFVLFILTGVSILFCYFAGKFGGREYWEFPPFLAIPIVISWILFGLNFFRTAFSKAAEWPVYMWMWATGIVFFLFTFLESYLWMLPFFKDNHIRDITIQWKSYGALTGSWNMLVYGTAIFLMERIKNDTSMARSRMAFAMYFLGFTNLLFGWAHHTYFVPMAPWIRHLAYGISMTELLIFAKIISDWRKSLESYRRDQHDLAFRFLIASDVWIFINLALAILISIPAVNVYTHGTHITVAHAMGSTIGINTMILLSSCIYITTKIRKSDTGSVRMIRTGFWVTNISLFGFFILLVIIGSIKGYNTIVLKTSFAEAMNLIKPWLSWFAFTGAGLLGGLTLIASPLIGTLTQNILTTRTTGKSEVVSDPILINENSPA